MAGGAWTLAHLAQPDATRSGRPSENAYSAMVELLCRRFLYLTWRERARQVHLGPACRRDCDICWDIALAHAVWATRKLHKHLVVGAPLTRGEIVRDWETILDVVTSPRFAETLVSDVRAALFRSPRPDDELYRFVHAIAAQLLPSAGGARGLRRTADWVRDPRLGVLAQREGWSVKPARDLLTRRMFADVRGRHPRGIAILVEVLKRLDSGSSDPYREVLSSESPDARALLDVIAELLAEPSTREWFTTEVEGRQSYNEHLERLRLLRRREVDGVADPSAAPGEADDMP